MPIYEYKCNDCGKIFEEHQSFNDSPLTECKFCKGNLRRIFSPVGIVFKGSGFHINDYGKSSKRDHSTSSSSTTEKKSKEKSKPTTETKAAAETKASTETKSPTAPKSTSTQDKNKK